MSRIKESPVNLIIYDTTLRDGLQKRDNRLPVEGRLRIAKIMDSWGVSIIEGGWPGANLGDTEVIRELKDLKLRAKIAAFGSTARIGVSPENDETLDQLLKSETPIITLVGKSSLWQVKNILKTPGNENLKTIYRSVEFLVNQGREVFFDAEHFFDGFSGNPKYALEALKAAAAGGATQIILCDTNGGSYMDLIKKGARAAKKVVGNKILGIHTHDDAQLALANTFIAIEEGARHIQGTANGDGERVGNANLFTIAAVADKLQCKTGLNLPQTKETAHYVADIIGIPLLPNKAVVGEDAFGHNAGLHTDAVRKNPTSYQWMDPEDVGNISKIFQTEQGGSATVLDMAQNHGFELKKGDPRIKQILEKMKDMRVLGDAQGFILLNEILGDNYQPFEIANVRTISNWNIDPKTMIKLRVNGNQTTVFKVADSPDGPLNATELALKSALRERYPEVSDIELFKFKSHNTNNGKIGTASSVIVTLTFKSKDGKNFTSQVYGPNQEKASEQTLVDAYKYWILKTRKAKQEDSKTIAKETVVFQT